MEEWINQIQAQVESLKQNFERHSRTSSIEDLEEEFCKIVDINKEIQLNGLQEEFFKPKNPLSLNCFGVRIVKDLNFENLADLNKSEDSFFNDEYLANDSAFPGNKKRVNGLFLKLFY